MHPISGSTIQPLLIANILLLSVTAGTFSNEIFLFHWGVCSYLGNVSYIAFKLSAVKLGHLFIDKTPPLLFCWGLINWLATSLNKIPFTDELSISKVHNKLQLLKSKIPLYSKQPSIIHSAYCNCEPSSNINSLVNLVFENAAWQ